MNYDYGKNYNLNLNNINNLNNLLQHRELLPKVPRRLSPIKKQI